VYIIHYAKIAYKCHFEEKWGGNLLKMTGRLSKLAINIMEGISLFPAVCVPQTAANVRIVCEETIGSED
jgi:hypothetical protein